MPRAGPHDGVRAEDVRSVAIREAGEALRHRGEGREVDHDLASGDRRVDRGRVGDVAAHELPGGLEVRDRAGREVVEDADLEALAREAICDVGADEAGASRDENAAPAHRSASPPGASVSFW